MGSGGRSWRGGVRGIGVGGLRLELGGGVRGLGSGALEMGALGLESGGWGWDRCY